MLDLDRVAVHDVPRAIPAVSSTATTVTSSSWSEQVMQTSS